MLGPFSTVSRLTPIHQVLLAVLSRAACTSMSTTTTTTTTCDRGDRYGPMEWAQLVIKSVIRLQMLIHFCDYSFSLLLKIKSAYLFCVKILKLR